MLVSFLIFPYDLSIILSRHLKKVKMSSKLITQGFYHFQVSFYLKKKNYCEYYIKCYVTWSEFSILRFLVYPLFPDIFDKSEFNVFMDRSVVKPEVKPTMNGKCVSND